ncbi:hypothetical protein MMC18_005809 [Xylographa bjoerkii]|nr:hypothetical protein [Xylographa bjoerkii]
MSSPIPVVGTPAVHATDGSVPLRLEIRQLQQDNPDQWNLYLVGLDALHNNVNESEVLSYFQVAGIHGRPYIDWNNVPGVSGQQWEGYCTHSSILFLPWHRPYLALYEQILYSAIQQIASRYSGDAQTKYQQAASTFRLPYWDWATTPPDTSFPQSMGSSDSVDVVVPGGDGSPVTKSIPNPLYSYSPDLNYINKGSWFASPYDGWGSTFRYPTQDDSGNIVSQDASVTAALDNQAQSIQQNVYLIMGSYNNFAAFSNTAWDQTGQPGAYGSLEDIHDNIHGTVGGSTPIGAGHMSILDYAAFDPVFWLHHCNVDRLFAMWQAINPNSYVVPKSDQAGTYTEPSNFTEDINTPLKPFYQNADKEFWTSANVVKTGTFQYAYPETQEWSFPNNQAYQSSVRTAINALYGGSAPSTVFATHEAALPPTRHQLAAVSVKHQVVSPKTVTKDQETNIPTTKVKLTPKQDSKRELFKSRREKAPLQKSLQLASTVPEDLTYLAIDGKYTEWIVNVRTEKHILGQTYSVHVFLGDFNEDPLTWPFEHNLVGTDTILGRASNTGCGKCKGDREAGLMVTGIVPLTAALIDDVREGLVNSLNPDDVVPYLTENLHWRVTLADGSHKLREDVPNLKVSVISTEVTIPTAPDQLPVHGEYTIHSEVTQGKPAGHNDGDRV